MKAKYKLLLATSFVLAALLFQNCSPGSFDSKATSNTILNSNSATGAGSGAGAGNIGSGPTQTKLDHGPRRLTYREMYYTLQMLFGNAILAVPQVKEARDNMTKDPTLDLVESFNSDVDELWMRNLRTLGLSLGEAVAANDDFIKQIVGSCASSTALPQDCLTNFVSNFGLKVYRRPVLPAEVNAFVNLSSGLSAKEVIVSTIASLILSPEFNFHVEGGNHLGDPNLLTPFEVANRLAFWLTERMPDAELLEAAKSGQLGTIEQARVHVQRLSSYPSAVEKMQSFFYYWLHFANNTDPDPAFAKFNGIEATGLVYEANRELFAFIRHVIYETPGTVKDLMSKPVAFPNTARLKKILGAPESHDGTKAFPTQRHRGLLLRPAFLLSPTGNTKPIIRGAIIRREILCDHVPDPPDNAENMDDSKEETVLENLSGRDRASYITRLPACAGCHTMLNPLGFALESYDPLGAWREKELVVNSDGKVLKEFAIDTKVSKAIVDSTQVVDINNADHLVDLIANGEKVKACFAKKIFERMRFRGVESEYDKQVVNLVKNRFGSGTILEGVEEMILQRDLFVK